MKLEKQATAQPRASITMTEKVEAREEAKQPTRQRRVRKTVEDSPVRGTQELNPELKSSSVQSTDRKGDEEAK